MEQKYYRLSTNCPSHIQYTHEHYTATLLKHCLYSEYLLNRESLLTLHWVIRTLVDFVFFVWTNASFWLLTLTAFLMTPFDRHVTSAPSPSTKSSSASLVSFRNSDRLDVCSKNSNSSERSSLPLTSRDRCLDVSLEPRMVEPLELLVEEMRLFCVVLCVVEVLSVPFTSTPSWDCEGNAVFKWSG